MFDITENAAESTTKAAKKLPNDLNNKLLYLKLQIAKYNYLILLSDIIEIKKTNLITSLAVASAHEKKIYGTFYYRHQIIPVYKIGIKRSVDEINIFIDDTKGHSYAKGTKKYKNLLIVGQAENYGLIIDDVSASEIIDINFSKSINTNEEYQIIDIKELIKTIKN